MRRRADDVDHARIVATSCRRQHVRPPMSSRPRSQRTVACPDASVTRSSLPHDRAVLWMWVALAAAWATIATSSTIRAQQPALQPARQSARQPARTSRTRTTAARTTTAFREATEVERVLPQSSIYDILEDREGYLWFATREGVSRWDGYEVRTWRHDPFDSTSLPGNVVRALNEDRYGNFWAVTSNYLETPAGLARIAGVALDSVHRVTHRSSSVAISPDGEPWMVTDDSILHYDRGTGGFGEPFPRVPTPHPREVPTLPGPVASAFGGAMITRDSVLLVAGRTRGLEACTLATATCRVIPFESDDAQSIGATQCAGNAVRGFARDHMDRTHRWRRNARRAADPPHASVGRSRWHRRCGLLGRRQRGRLAADRARRAGASCRRHPRGCGTTSRR